MFMNVTAFDNYLFLWPVHRVGSVYSNSVSESIQLPFSWRASANIHRWCSI